jgi:hypothetical protein
MVQTFAEVIDKFDGPAEFARAVGMTPGAAKQAKRRNSLGAHWFPATAEAARKRGLKEINEKTLAQLAEGRRAEPTASASSASPPASQ